MDPAKGGGLYVARGPFEAHLFRLARVAPESEAAAIALAGG